MKLLMNIIILDPKSRATPFADIFLCSNLTAFLQVEPVLLIVYKIYSIELCRHPQRRSYKSLDWLNQPFW